MLYEKGILRIPLNYEGEIVTVSIIPDGDPKDKCFYMEPEKAEKICEAPYQILEAHSYTYEIDKKDVQLSCSTSGVVSPNPSDSFSYGRITTRNYVGTLSLNVGEQENALQIEVLATKFDTEIDSSYRKNYQKMLKDIASKSSDLLMQVNSPVRQSFEIDYEKDNETIYQRFTFIHSLIQAPEFEEAILRIISSPKTTWSIEEEEKDIRSIRRFKSGMVRQLASKGNRSPLPKGHQLEHLVSVPNRLTSARKVENLDNPENRFIKHVLNVYLRFCEECADLFKERMGIKESREYKEAKQASDQLESFLQQSFFNEISRPTSLPLGSPTLQRKTGYRQILRTWLMSELAASLTWKGGEDVYTAGKKNIATLYEYWLFFELHDLFKKKFDIKTKDDERLIEIDADKMHLRLKGGTHLELTGSHSSHTRSFNVGFSFNRVFSGGKVFKNDKLSGSWTTSMRPDYTLSFWPADKTQEKSEEEELIVHIHFDAKYKVDQFNIDDEQLNDVDEIKTQERIGEYRNGDLLKMHAYKDAIRRTSGAYILYPGTELQKKRGFHEIIPGLGAFALNPSQEAGQLEELEQFIDEVLETLENRASQSEQQAQSNYVTHKDAPSIVRERMPEYFINENASHRQEKLLPQTTNVLVGFYNTISQYDWIVKNKKYNFRMDSVSGSLVLDTETVSSKYLLLHTHKDKESGDLWKIVSRGPRVFSKAKMKKLKYANPSQDYYLVIELEPVDLKDFGNSEWNFKKLTNYQTQHASAYPFTTTLAELYSNKL